MEKQQVIDSIGSTRLEEYKNKAFLAYQRGQDELGHGWLNLAVETASYYELDFDVRNFTSAIENKSNENQFEHRKSDLQNYIRSRIFNISENCSYTPPKETSKDFGFSNEIEQSVQEFVVKWHIHMQMVNSQLQIQRAFDRMNQQILQNSFMEKTLNQAWASVAA
ncbi:hypothetical protein [Candidatus Uabimicrobium amorphum]|uniref:Uncharacterized protein n=1 Tax=Uabimicrobium amorphum TaxID=2596890 RepID=A0A5S9F6W6_UABAM|nr:hypothetical protein [Candidatus Uabimicrobium amorphum]BBM87129.1 hypothetical protein UABAM_05532 [Candidatus Uabimicrobium amorphum]